MKGLSSIVEPVLKKIIGEFTIGSFGTGVFDTDNYRIIFCEAGYNGIFVSVFAPNVSADSMLPYVY